MSKVNFWRECISISAESCGLPVTPEQLDALAEDVAHSHDMYSEYSGEPGCEDRLIQISMEHNMRIKELEAENEENNLRAEKAVKRILGVRQDDKVSIDQHGFVEVVP